MWSRPGRSPSASFDQSRRLFEALLPHADREALLLLNPLLRLLTSEYTK